jgi:hypothetical protein
MPDPEGNANPESKPLLSLLIVFLPASRKSAAYNTPAKVEHDALGHREMTSKNRPATFSSPVEAHQGEPRAPRQGATDGGQSMDD